LVNTVATGLGMPTRQANFFKLLLRVKITTRNAVIANNEA